MSARPTIRLPDDVMSIVPSGKKEMLDFLAQYVDSTMLAAYREDFKRRVSGPLGEPFARHELALLRDYSIFLLLGDLKAKLEEELPSAKAVASK